MISKPVVLCGVGVLVVGSLLMAQGPRNTIAPPIAATHPAEVGDVPEATTLDDSALAEVRGKTLSFGGLDLAVILIDNYWHPKARWKRKLKGFFFGRKIPGLVQI